jgi:hydrogenase nickel incorporation protein HypB
MSEEILPQGKETMMEIKVLENILKANDAIALENARLFKERGLFAINMMGSPGSGKTTVLEMTVKMLTGKRNVAVIEGDISTTIDAERLIKYGIPVVQITTETFGGTCHLDANMVARAFDKVPATFPVELLCVENVGNLVCPAGFKLGTEKNVLVLSVAEGEDKPLKYPAMFRNSDILLLNKIDLLGHLDYAMDKLNEAVRKINPLLPIIPLSAKSGEGVDGWIAWLEKEMRSKKGS